MSDEELIRIILDGDTQSFRQLIQRYHVMVINTCFGLLHLKEDAEDIAQEVFLEVYQSLSRFRNDSKLSTWIYRIAINKSLNHLRKVKYRSKTNSIEQSSSKEGIELSVAASDLPFEQLTQKEMSLLLHEAIDALPENQRTAFVLHKYEDLPYKEIAEIMHLSLSAVESLIHRAKMCLQKNLLCYYK